MDERGVQLNYYGGRLVVVYDVAVACVLCCCVVDRAQQDLQFDDWHSPSLCRIACSEQMFFFLVVPPKTDLQDFRRRNYLQKRRW